MDECNHPLFILKISEFPSGFLWVVSKSSDEAIFQYNQFIPETKKMGLLSLGDHWDDTENRDCMWKFNIGSCWIEASNTHVVPLPPQGERKVISRAG